MSTRPKGLPGSSTYRERLWPGPLLLAVVPLAVAPLAVAYGAVFGPVLGWLIAVALIALGWAWLLGSSPRIEVDADAFHAGRAHIPLRFIGQVTRLDRASLADIRRTDVRAYAVLRPGTAREAVSIMLTDPADPHTRWLVNTRRPELLIAALDSATHC